MPILELTPAHPRWPDYCAHLHVCNHGQWVIDEHNIPLKEEMIFFAALDGDQVVGSLSLIHHPIVIPPTEWAGDRDRTLRDAEGNPLYEMLVETFYVDPLHRRHGHGRDLQLAALEKTRELGCFQMRSWSSMDKPANYQLKLSLGFAFHPEVQVTASGLKVSGGYFIRPV